MSVKQNNPMKQAKKVTSVKDVLTTVMPYGGKVRPAMPANVLDYQNRLAKK